MGRRSLDRKKNRLVDRVKKNGAPRRLKKANRWDEEIDSDDEAATQENVDVAINENDTNSAHDGTGGVSGVHDEGEDDLFEIDESPEEARVRIAKQFLERLELTSKTDSQISERLKREAEISSRKVHYYVADRISVAPPTFLRGHKDALTCVGVGAKDSTKVFTGAKDCSILYWDIPTQTKTVLAGKRKEFNCGGHFERVLDLSVSDDGKVIVSVGGDRVVRVWDVRASTTACVASLHGHSATITGVCVEPTVSGARRIYTVSEDKSLRLWSLDTQTCQDSLFGHTAAPVCIDILAHERPVTGGLDNSVRVWKIATESHLLFYRHTESVDAVTQLNGHRTVSGSQDGSIMLWSVSSRKPVCTVTDAHNGSWITALGCLRYSDTFFSGSDDGAIRMWKVAGNHAQATHKVNKQGGKRETAISEVASCRIPVTGVVNQIVTSEDGRFLFAAVGKEHRLGRWKSVKDARNGLLVAALEGSLATAEPDTIDDL